MSERIMLERPQTGVLPGQDQTPPPSPQEPIQAPPETAPAVQAPPPENAPAPTGEPVAGTPTPSEPSAADWQRRVDQLTREKYEARRLAEEAQARAAGLERQFRQPPPAQHQPPAYGPPGESPEAAEERAYQRYKNDEMQARFNQACNTLYAKGREEYGEGMDEAVRGLNAVGYGNRPEVLAAITRLPDGHRIYRQLASNLDNAARLLAMEPMDWQLELARMSVNGAAASPTPAPPPVVTRAPEPIRPVGGSTRAAPKALDKMTTAEFIRERDSREVGSLRIRR